jgi:hypothetical protein
VKLPVVALAAILNEPGTLRFALLLDSDTDAPALGAAPLRVIVQLAVPEALSVSGVQERLLTKTEDAAVVVAETTAEYALRLPAWSTARTRAL